MISFNLIIGLVLFIMATLFASIVVFNILLQNRNKDKLDNVFFTRFPQESLKVNDSLVSVLKTFYYVYAGFSFSAILVILPNINSFGNFGIYTIVISSLFGLSGLLLMVNNAIDIYYVKQHILISTIFMASVFLTLVLTTSYGILVYNVWNKTGEGSPISIVLSVLSGIASILSLLLIVNPKLKDWPRLIKEGESETYKRPKMFPLAYTEWAFILLHFISFILFIFILVRF